MKLGSGDCEKHLIYIIFFLIKQFSNTSRPVAGGGVIPSRWGHPSSNVSSEVISQKIELCIDLQGTQTMPGNVPLQHARARQLTEEILLESIRFSKMYYLIICILLKGCFKYTFQHPNCVIVQFTILTGLL